MSATNESSLAPVEEFVGEVDVNTRIDESITPIKLISDEAFIAVATDYQNIDSGFAYATFALETGYGTSDLWVYHNNPAGITCGVNYCSYSSQEEGYRAMFDLLSSYTDCNLRTVDQVRERWSETDDSWQIVSIWNEILKGEIKQ